MSRGKKIAFGVVVVFLVLATALVLLVPVLADLDRYRPRVAALIENETGKPTQIGRLTLTVFPVVSIRVDDLALGNPKGFPHGDFLRARQIYVEVDGRALWDRRVIIRALEMSEPAINLLSDGRGRWNFENPSAPKAVPKTSSEPPLFSLGVIERVTMSGGQITAAQMTSSGRRGAAFFEARGVSSQLEQVDLNAFASSATAAHAPSQALHRGGWLTSVAYAAAPQTKPAAQGLFKAESLRLGTLQATSLQCKVRLFPKRVDLQDLSFKLYEGLATGDLSFDFAAEDLRYTVNAQLSGVDVAKLLAAFPEAKGMMTGTMDGTMKLAGVVSDSPDPLAGMQGAGHVSIRNGQLPSLQLNKNLMLLARFSDLGPAKGDPSSFSSISADINIANQKISSNKISVVGNGVDIDGSGALALAGEGSLNHDGVAKIVAGQNRVTNILASLSGATFTEGKLTLPFTIGGNFQKPLFRLKAAQGGSKLGVLQQLTGGSQAGQSQPAKPEEVVRGLVGLFKKKQPPQQQQAQPQPPPSTQAPR